MKVVALAIGGFVAAYVVVAALSILTTALLGNLWPAIGTADQSRWLETLDFTYALVYMGVGGYVAKRLGGMAAAWVLGGAFVILGLLTAVLQLDSIHSGLYQWLVAVSAGGAVWVGTRLAGRRGRTPA